MRLYYKPFVRWIWFGGLLIAIGGLLAASDRRYRMAVRDRAPAALGSDGLIANGGS
jgi:cytochrome c-type biogenesis protein CcmF